VWFPVTDIRLAVDFGTMRSVLPCRPSKSFSPVLPSRRWWHYAKVKIRYAEFPIFIHHSIQSRVQFRAIDFGFDVRSAVVDLASAA
jgi:hypothetical protein